MTAITPELRAVQPVPKELEWREQAIEGGIITPNTKLRRHEGRLQAWRPCGRCGGTGNVGIYWVDGGICFACADAKGVWRDVQRLAAYARAKVAREAKRQAEADEAPRRAARDARQFLAAHDGLAEALRIDDPFVRSLSFQLARKGALSAKQVAAAARILAEHRERGDRQDVRPPEGRFGIGGTVLSVKTVEGYMPGSFVDKMVVEIVDEPTGDTFRLYGTVPSAIDTVERGDTVHFNANIEPKEVGFGYFKRPAKAEIVKKSE